MKPINLSSKEIRRASGDLTLVVRRQAANGQYMVAAVSLRTKLPIFKPSFVEKFGIAQAVKEELRMADKCGFNSPMASASRDRFFEEVRKVKKKLINGLRSALELADELNEGAIDREDLELIQYDLEVLLKMVNAELDRLARAEG